MSNAIIIGGGPVAVGEIDGLTEPLQFRGAIALAADFPTSAEVQSGWTYRVTAAVTDNDATKTNTSQTFDDGDEISWNGTDWSLLSSPTEPASPYDRINALIEAVMECRGASAYRTQMGRTIDAVAGETGVDATPTDAEYNAFGDTYLKSYAVKNDDGFAADEVSKLLGTTTAGWNAVEAFDDYDFSMAGWLGNTGVNYWTGLTQSFQLSSGSDVGRVRMNLNKSSSPGRIQCRIETDSAGEPSGTLAHANLDVTINEPAGGWITFEFASAGALAASTTYWIVLTLPDGDPGAGKFWTAIGMLYTNSYASGMCLNETVGAWTPVLYDMAFSVEVWAAAVFQSKLAQSFQLTVASPTVNKLVLPLKKTLTPGTITVRIETDNAGEPSGSLVHANATATISEGDVAGTMTSETITFDGTFALAASTTYWAVLSLASDPGTGEYYETGNWSAASGYASGLARYFVDGDAWYDDSLIDDWLFKIQDDAVERTVQTISYTADTSPDRILVAFLVDDDGGSLAIDVSRDGGTTWTAGSPQLMSAGVSAGADAYYADVNVSAQPVGTDIRFRMRISGVPELKAIHGWGVDYNG